MRGLLVLPLTSKLESPPMLTDQLGTKKSCSFNRIRFGVSAHQKGAKKKKKKSPGGICEDCECKHCWWFSQVQFYLDLAATFIKQTFFSSIALWVKPAAIIRQTLDLGHVSIQNWFALLTATPTEQTLDQLSLSESASFILTSPPPPLKSPVRQRKLSVPYGSLSFSPRAVMAPKCRTSHPFASEEGSNSSWLSHLASGDKPDTSDTLLATEQCKLTAVSRTSSGSNTPSLWTAILCCLCSYSSKIIPELLCKGKILHRSWHLASCFPSQPPNPEFCNQDLRDLLDTEVSADDDVRCGQRAEWILFRADFPSYGSGPQGKLLTAVGWSSCYRGTRPVVLACGSLTPRHLKGISVNSVRIFVNWRWLQILCHSFHQEVGPLPWGHHAEWDKSDRER